MTTIAHRLPQPKFSRIINAEGEYLFRCPGCNDVHHIDKRWKFNNDIYSPTLDGSVLCRTGHYMPEWKNGDPCWCTYNEKHLDLEDYQRFKCVLCHSFVKDGFIEFLADCSHPSVNQRLEIPEWSC